LAADARLPADAVGAWDQGGPYCSDEVDNRIERAPVWVLERAAVERSGRESGDVDVVEAADIDCDHLIALGIFAARECPHAALPAEQMVEGLLAELIVLEVLRARAQPELFGRHERPQRATLLAERTIACGDAAEVGRHLEAHLAAMAAAGIRLGFGHGVWPISVETRSACPAARDRRAGPRIAGSNNSTCRRTPSAPRSVFR